MDVIIFKVILLLSLTLFVLPKKIQYFFLTIIGSIIIFISSKWAISAFTQNLSVSIDFIKLIDSSIILVIDKLSAFFILIVNFTVLTALIYSKNYLKPYSESKNNTEFSIHYFSFLWLYISMLLVVMIRQAIGFLVAWELMSLFSFFLVVFDFEKKETLKIGLNYLIQMHIGFVFILIAFLAAYIGSDTIFSFDGLAQYFSAHNPFPVFLLFFIGFGIKAGFIPLHTWLPHAHPAAPSHVSGVMSGVMIKMGVYGILRVLTNIHTNLMTIGVFMLVVSIISGVTGILYASYQNDFKKLLAYCSIENIGIIGIGISIGIIGIAVNMPLLAALGFAGGLLHILNHSLFKSLLFYSAGNVYLQTHTRNIDQLGGLIKKMPKTALIFLIGALAISGLPPFNGFVSEFLIYSGLFQSLKPANLSTDIIIFVSFIAISLIGGIAIFSFTKLFSVMFLGTGRSEKVANAKETNFLGILPQILILIPIFLIGILPMLIIKPLNQVVNVFTETKDFLNPTINILNSLSITLGIFVGIVIIIWLLRQIFITKNQIKYDSTWGCGYTGANPATHQYSGESYSDIMNIVSKHYSMNQKEFDDFDESEILPKKRTFRNYFTDVYEKYVINKPTDFVLKILTRSGIFQTGKIQHYLLYALVFLALILILSLFNIM